MLSSDRSVNYPQSDNLFNEFFKLVVFINSAAKPEILRLIFPKIKKYDDQHKLMAVHFDSQAIGINQLSPTPEQMALYAAEGTMLCMLRVLCTRKSQSFGEQIALEPYQADLDKLRYQLRPKFDVDYPLAHAIHMFMSISVEILLLNECTVQLSESDIEQFIFTGMIILDCIYKFKKTFGKLAKHQVANVAPTFAEEWQCLAYVFIYDTKPENPSQNFAAFLADIYAKKLIRCHLQIERKMRPLNGLLEHRPTYNRLCTLLAEVDSMTRRVNLYQSQDERKLFDRQAKKYSHGSSSFDITLWCNSTVAENLYVYLDITLKNLYSRLDYIQILDCYLRTLNISKIKFNTDFNTILMYQAEAMLFKAKLLKQHAYELSDDPIANEVPEARLERLKQYDVLNQGISLFISTIGGMLYAMRKARGQDMVMTIWTRNILGAIADITIDAIDFREIESELSCCNAGLMFEIITGYKFADTTESSKRQDVSSCVADNIIKLITQTDEYREFLTPEQRVYARQFVLDYYYTSLLECRTNADCAPLLNQYLIVIIRLQMTGENSGKCLKNYPLYKAIDTFLMLIKREGLSLHDVDDNFFRSLEAQDQLTLCVLCQHAIEMIEDNTFRVSTTLRIFAIEFATKYLTFLSKSNSAVESEAAKILLKRLHEFYMAVNKFTIGCFKNILVSKIAHEPVRMIASDPASFLPEPAKTPTRSPVKPANKVAAVKPEEVTVIKKPRFNIELSYDENVKILEGDMPAVFNAYDKLALNSKDKRLNLRAFLGLARHLQDMADNRQRARTVKKLLSHKDIILQGCQSYAVDFNENEFHQQCDAYIKPWIPEENKSVTVQVLSRSSLETNTNTKEQSVTNVTLFNRKISNDSTRSHEETTQRDVRYRDSTARGTTSYRKFSNNRTPYTENARRVSTNTTFVRPLKKGAMPQPIPYVWKTRALAQVASESSVIVPPVVMPPASPVESPRVTTSVVTIAPQPFSGIFGNLVLTIKQNPLEAYIVKLLHASGMVPYFHGGRVVYSAMLNPTIEIKPEPDLDIGCFPRDREALFQLLVENRDVLGILDIKKDIWHDDKYHVYHIMIRDKANFTLLEKVEIAYIPVTSIEEIPEKLREKAESFGTNATAFCDASTMKILYPTRQLRLFIEKRIIDVAWDESEEMSAEIISSLIKQYLKDAPQRQLDCVDRLAKLGHYGCPLVIAPRLMQAIFLNRFALQQYLVSFTKVDKLFLQGYAVDSFSIMHQLNMLTVLFPMLKHHHIPVFYRACVMIDEVIRGYSRNRLTSDDLIEYRMQFLAAALFVSFMEGWVSDASKDDAYHIFTECTKFLKQTRVYISAEYINFTRIQDIFSDYIKKYLNYETALDHIDQAGGISADCVSHLTGMLIVNPVFCTLDCRTYEEEEIKSWLTVHRMSPANGCHLQQWQKIEDVLMPNEDVRAAIAIYLESLERQHLSELTLETTTFTK